MLKRDLRTRREKWYRTSFFVKRIVKHIIFYKLAVAALFSYETSEQENTVGNEFLMRDIL